MTDAAVAFEAVPCPVCRTQVMEIATGLARAKCPQCKSRIMAGRTPSGELRVVRVDKRSRQNLTFAHT